MKARARRARALLRYRRRYGGTGSRGYQGGRPIIGPITGYELYLIHRYGC